MAYVSPSPASRWLRENWARLQDYRGQWVVAAEGRVIASGADLDAVLAEVGDNPLDDLAIAFVDGQDLEISFDRRETP